MKKGREMLDFQLSNFKDIDNTVMPLINQYYSYLEANDFANAAKILEENSELLKPYKLDMNDVNKIQEAVSELADIAFSTQAIIISDTEPTSSNIGDGTEWYQPY